ncbi:MAG: zf-HC2 domain-containing protein [Phycisphaerae bacterium]|jgi:anti-sigma factor RsiW
MRECEQISRVSAYHDGEMPPAERAEFRQHLSQCVSCAAELERLERLTALLSSLPPPATPPWMLDRLYRAVDLRPVHVLRRMAEALSAVAAVILIACLAGLAMRSSSQASAGAMPVWESRALNQQSEESTFGGREELVAQWMAQDLSGKDGL